MKKNILIALLTAFLVTVLTACAGTNVDEGGDNIVTPTPTSSVTANTTPEATPTTAPTETSTETSTETLASTLAPTASPTLAQTETPVPTATETPEPTETPVPTPLPTQTATPTETPTPKPTATPTPTKTPEQRAAEIGYNTFYMENDRVIYYASDDGMTSVAIVKETGETFDPMYTAEGIKANYPEIGQPIYNEDGTLKILTCGCCMSVEDDYGITSFRESQETARLLGYVFDHTEDHEDFIANSWIGYMPDSWPHNLGWYCYVKVDTDETNE